MTRVLDRAIARVGAAPKYTVTDQGVQFRDVFKRWCRRTGVAPRFGAVGKHGSIAVTERFILSMKTEFLRRILVPFDGLELRNAIARYIDWYNGCRPHRSLGGATPLEVYCSARPANETRRIEPRCRYPAEGVCAKPQSAARAGKRPRKLELVVSGLHGAPASLLPIITLREAAERELGASPPEGIALSSASPLPRQHVTSGPGDDRTGERDCRSGGLPLHVSSGKRHNIRP